MADVMTLGVAMGIGFVVGVGVLLWRSQPVTEPRSRLDHAFARAAEVHPTLVATYGNAMQPATLAGTALGLSVATHQFMRRGSSTAPWSSQGQRTEYVTELHVSGGAGALAGGLLNNRGRGRSASTPKVVTGDPAFDDAVSLAGTDPLALLAQLTPERRRTMVLGKRWGLEGGTWKTELPEEPDVDDVVDGLEAVAALVDLFRDTIPTEEGLRNLVDSDPIPEVRAKVLEVWLQRGSPPEGDLRRWAAGDGATALSAAEALGEDGVPFLVELLDRPALALGAALALSRCDAPERVRGEAVLLAALSDGNPQVIEALARVGGKGSVAPLQALGAPARDAVAAVQERLRASGGSAGGVALAGEGGQLSIPRPTVTEG